MARRSLAGFTLLETLIYIALLGIVIGGMLAVVYQIAQSSTRLDTHNATQEEGNFVLRKIGWALTGVKTIAVPAANGTSATLTVTRYDGTKIDFKLSVGKVWLAKNGGTFTPITTSNVSVTSLTFLNTGSTPAGIIATVVVDGLTFTTTRYLPK